jgi:pyruvate/2-oxoglutarate dehydrogenase complex dihydrolipoamide dehydrogenase (E3) component
MVQRFDAIVIGAGQAGPPLAERLTGAGKSVALVEREHLGGTCVNDGCTPTKALVASAYAAFLARRHADFGVTISGEIGIDMAAVKARKDAIVAASVASLGKWLQGMQGLTLFNGHARFVAPKRLRVGDEELEAEHVFINVGGRPVVPDWPALREIPYLTNTSIMAVDFVPPHLVVIGGSYVGLEFAQMYRRFGSRVTVVEQGERLISREDPEVSEAVREILEREGIAVRCHAQCIDVAPHADGVAVKMDCKEGEPEIVGSHLLLAIGRRPNTDDLGLDAAGIKTGKRGYIEVDESLQTNVPGIWALGDVNGRGAFTHTSWNDYEIVAANLIDGEARRVSDRIQAYALYIDPPLGRIGISEHEGREQGRKLLVGRMPMTRVGRARERGETLGFMKVLVDADTRRILGAALLGVGGDEVVQGMLDLMYADASVDVLARRAVHIHPTVYELLPTLLQGLKPLD